MLQRITTTLLALTICITAAFADDGEVVRVDTKTKEIVVLVDKTEHTAALGSIKLLGTDGKAATIDQFTKGKNVEVTMDGKKIKSLKLKK